MKAFVLLTNGMNEVENRKTGVTLDLNPVAGSQGGRE